MLHSAGTGVESGNARVILCTYGLSWTHISQSSGLSNGAVALGLSFSSEIFPVYLSKTATMCLDTTAGLVEQNKYN